MKSSVNFFRLRVIGLDSIFYNFNSLAEVSCYIEDCPFALDYDGKLLQCCDEDGELLFLLSISVSVLFKSDYDNFTVYSINYSMFDF